ILLGYALQIKNLQKVIHHATALIDDGSGTLDTALIARIAAEEMHGFDPSAPGLLEKLVVAGQKLPRELVSFNRGYFMINQLLRQTGSPRGLFEISGDLGRALIGQDIMARVVGWGRIPKNELAPTPLSGAQLWGVTIHETKNSCSSALRSLMFR
ncbi:MAG: hypothetical protein ABIR96_10765, partial [Bdellovibrionota bacterium]